MIPGPNKIIECPHCRALHKYRTLLSGNTFLGTVWTDGYASFPMMPTVPEVTKCRKCDSIFYLREAVVIGEYGGIDRESTRLPDQSAPVVPSEWHDVPMITPLGSGDCYRALNMRLYSNRCEEMDLCLTAWHVRNHQVRQMSATRREAMHRKHPKSTSELKNVIAASSETVKVIDRLMALLDEQVPDERILKAEALRELGRFEEVLVVLKDPFPEELQELSSFIRVLAEQGLFQVMELPRG